MLLRRTRKTLYNFFYTHLIAISSSVLTRLLPVSSSYDVVNICFTLLLRSSIIIGVCQQQNPLFVGQQHNSKQNNKVCLYKYCAEIKNFRVSRTLYSLLGHIAAEGPHFFSLKNFCLLIVSGKKRKQ